METTLLTRTQIQRKASAMIKKYIAAKHPTLQYYFIRGLFHINNIDGMFNAKMICEAATGLDFISFTNSIAKLDKKY